MTSSVTDETPFAATGSPPYPPSTPSRRSPSAQESVAGNRITSQLSGYPSKLHDLDVQNDQDKASNARKVFRLPADQELVTSVFCSMKRQGIYYNGELYVFKEFIGFSAYAFGAEKLKIIPMETVRAIRKRRHYGDPTAVEIKWAASKYSIFASLRDRDSIIKILTDLWQDANPEAYQYFCKTPGMKETWREKKINRLTSFLGMHSAATDELESITDFREGVSEGDDVTVADMEDADADTALVVKEQWIRALSNASSCPEDTPAPLPSDAALICSGNLPHSLHHFVNTIHLSEFMRQFQEKQNSKDVMLTPWEAGGGGNLVRNMEFTIVRKNPFGPSEFRCHQQQRICIYAHQHVVFQTELIMPDIPYGEYFHVCTRWDFHPVADKELKWEMHGWCNFVKSTVFKKQILSNCVTNLKESSKIQLDAVKEELERNMVQGGETKEGEVQRSLQSLLRTIPASHHSEMGQLIEARMKGDKKAVARLLNLSTSGKELQAQLSHSKTLSRSSVPAARGPWLVITLIIITLLQTAILLLVLHQSNRGVDESLQQLAAVVQQMQSGSQCASASTDS